MAKKKVAYRKKNQNKLSMFLVVLVVLMIMVVVAVRSVELRQKLEEVTAQEVSLNAQIAAEEERTEEIAEYAKYTKTKKYIVEMAQELLGLVFEEDIVFTKEE